MLKEILMAVSGHRPIVKDKGESNNINFKWNFYVFVNGGKTGFYVQILPVGLRIPLIDSEGF